MLTSSCCRLFCLMLMRGQQGESELHWCLADWCDSALNVNAEWEREDEMVMEFCIILTLHDTFSFFLPHHKTIFLLPHHFPFFHSWCLALFDTLEAVKEQNSVLSVRLHSVFNIISVALASTVLGYSWCSQSDVTFKATLCNCTSTEDWTSCEILKKSKQSSKSYFLVTLYFCVSVLVHFIPCLFLIFYPLFSTLKRFFVLSI